MKNKRAKIMLVDDNLANLDIGKGMLKDNYEVYTVPSAWKMFEILDKIQVDLILLDIEMPEVNGYEAIQQLKENPVTANIPIIFLTSQTDTDSEVKGLSLGAIDYVHKPFSAPLVLQRIKNHLLIAAQSQELKNYNNNLQEMVFQQMKQIFELQSSMIHMMAELMEFRDDMTGKHIIRTRLYVEHMLSEIILRKIYADETRDFDLNFVSLAAELHDLGKIAIPDNILNKPARLEPKEFDIMMTHAIVGEQIIERIEQRTSGHDFLRYAKRIAGGHHEKWDGSGYPRGLSGKDIPLEARIMAIADVYDALISARPYKDPFPHKKAIKIIQNGSGTHFDPMLTGVFLSIADRFDKAAAENRDE